MTLYLQVDDSQPLVNYTVTVRPAGHQVLPIYGQYVGTYVLPPEMSPLKRKVTVVGHVYFVEGEL